MNKNKTSEELLAEMVVMLEKAKSAKTSLKKRYYQKKALALRSQWTKKAFLENVHKFNVVDEKGAGEQ